LSAHILRVSREVRAGRAFYVLSADASSAHQTEGQGAFQRRSAVSTAPRCALCGEVIGVYEPLVRLCEGQAHEGSRALEPQAIGRDSERYHRACFQRLKDGRLPAADSKDHDRREAP
jgi:hypothetical protein